MPILVTTMGTTWAVVPELYAFTNPEACPLYANHRDRTQFADWRREYDVEPVDEVWVVTTNGERVLDQRKILDEWAKLARVSLRQFSDPGLRELASVEECERMGDLIYRVVLAAHAKAGTVYLSLAGGRKTMSADLQQASGLFGCAALLHVVDSGPLPSLLRQPVASDLLAALPEDVAACLTPLVVAGRLPPSPLLEVGERVVAERFPARAGAMPDLLREMRERQRRAGALLCNYRRQLAGDTPTSFRALYALEPATIRQLQETFVGVDPARRDEDLAWLRGLPKAELHCHLGGILAPGEMIEVAEAEVSRVREARLRNSGFGIWLRTVRRAVVEEDLPRLRQECPGSGKELRTRFADIPEPLAVCGFLQQFEDEVGLLEQWIYGELLDPERFRGVGIRRYESLGDLQGSGLLQSEPCLRVACQALVRRCRADGVTYCEVRCSPCNYTRGGLGADRVVEILLDELAEQEGVVFRLLFIASRHGSMSLLYRHIELAQQLLDGSEPFRRAFVGFDLAGVEAAKRPAELRPAFLPLMERCLNLTIHAGEGEDAASIWQAVYHLNADRIGHGLSLLERPELLDHLLDRRIAIELCPSSNCQIVGYRSAHAPDDGRFPEYPLRALLAKGARVTLNTDDPGISRTTLSEEYWRAAAMCPGGLSRWQVLLLVRNGFRASFAAHADRRAALLAAEGRILEQILETPR